MPTVQEELIHRGFVSSEIKSLLQNGKVFLQGMPTMDGRREIKSKDLEVHPNAPRVRPGRDPVLLYRDDDLAVVIKPAGYLSVRATHRHKDPNIMGFVYGMCGNALPVHRLDEETSGLMVVALNEKSQERLKNQLEKREVSRRYWAISSGWMTKKQSVENMLFRNRGDGLRGQRSDGGQFSKDDGKKAISHFQPLEKLQGGTLIQCTLETGRTHQIRIHLNDLGHTVLGDSIYGTPRIAARSKRLALHAFSLSFKHPKTQEEMLFRIPLPDDLEKLRRIMLYQEPKESDQEDSDVQKNKAQSSKKRDSHKPSSKKGAKIKKSKSKSPKKGKKKK